ncbi:hypothetical protein HPB48_012246 [Haemaphysalis longicornis]|uniref:Uncharacterized protein n=1 Tax=Haemaphysalis longicornis TaxID=44386 RepID=A0A9J6G7R0_HAELO|nr:hypothetical protein HPB48_012246 [Haemaphysalis longicornis]
MKKTTVTVARTEATAPTEHLEVGAIHDAPPNGNVENSEPRVPAEPSAIRDVWASNLDDAFDTIMYLIPTALVRPDDPDLVSTLYQYSLVRDNVNMLMILIQLDFPFQDEDG